VSLEQRHDELRVREGRLLIAKRFSSAARLHRKRDAARQKALLRNEAWARDYYSKPN
jgi:hypothetical protein